MIDCLQVLHTISKSWLKDDHPVAKSMKRLDTVLFGWLHSSALFKYWMDTGVTLGKWVAIFSIHCCWCRCMQETKCRRRLTIIKSKQVRKKGNKTNWGIDFVRQRCVHFNSHVFPSLAWWFVGSMNYKHKKKGKRVKSKSPSCLMHSLR